jgi:hypothetical protein
VIVGDTFRHHHGRRYEDGKHDAARVILQLRGLTTLREMTPLKREMTPLKK